MQAHLIVLPGDGIGPEVTACAVEVLQKVAAKFGHTFTMEQRLIGGASIDAHGTALTDDTLAACQKSHAVLLGAVGGPKWDDPTAKVRPEQGLLALRKGLGVFANLRPVKVFPQLLDASPLKPEILKGVDLLVMRELTGGLYFATPRFRDRNAEGQERAVDTLEYFDYEIERIVDLAFRLAQGRRKKVTSVDKANVIETSRLWRQIATKVSKNYPDVQLDHMLVDTAAMRLVAAPSSFDVMVTENMFGDILTDEASVLAGSMGMLPSASLGKGGPGLYEPIHGSAPDIAGKGIANPIGTILSAALLLRYSLQLETEARHIEAAVEHVVAAGHRSKDLGGSKTTTEISHAILNCL
ncbi:MAG: 3-isopropylmalate dehydrogenase [Gemmatales bacterium]